nr:MAG TPA: hypothetical protein [Caudoviricetes sp.]
MLFNYNINPLIRQKKKRGIMMKKVIITIVAVVAIVTVAFKINALENQNRELKEDIEFLYGHRDLKKDLSEFTADMKEFFEW